MTDLGATDTSTTSLSTNQFPVSAAWVPNDALRAIEGIATNTDGGGKHSTAIRLGLKDGDDVTQGTSTDANTANTVMGRLTKIRDLLNTTLAVTQSGTWNITNISGTISLPTGAATSAKQPALGTAGAASSDVLTVQGITSMTALKVDGSGVTQPVSGTFWQATQPVSGTVASTQSGTWTVQPGNTANTTAWKVDGSAVTQPVSAASLPLPSGASTSAKQPALGTAGTASSDVLTVQGIASMTALKVDGSGVTQPVSGTVTANAGTGTFTNQQSNITTDYDTGAGTQTMTMFGFALPASGGSVAGGTSTNPIQVTLANTGANSTAVKVDGSAVTQPVSLTSTTVTGTVAVTESGTWSVRNQDGAGNALTTNSSTFTAKFAQDTNLLGTLGTAFSTAGKVDVKGADGDVFVRQATGSNLHVQVDSAPTTAVTQSGTWTVQPGNTANTTAWKVDGSAVTQPVSGTVSITANSAVNIAQMNGTATTMGNGISGTGVQRVTLASDSTGQVALATGANTIGALTANQSVNVNQFGGVATQMGNTSSTAITNTLLTSLGVYNGTSSVYAAQSSNGDGINPWQVLAATSMRFNGSQVDREYANQDNISLISASGVTTTQTGGDQTNYNSKGVIVTLNTTSIGTGSVTLEIDMKDPVSGTYKSLLTGAAVITNVTNIYTVYPGAPATANVSANSPLTRTWRVKVVANNANATTYTVGASIIN